MYFEESKRRHFLFAPSPTPGTGPLQTILHTEPEGLDLSRELPGGMVTSQFEPCIITSKNGKSSQSVNRLNQARQRVK